MSKSVCRLWGKRKIKGLTADGKTLRWCGVQLRLNGKVEVLEVKGKLLDFDFLLVMDAIKSLGEVYINQTSEVRFTTDDVPVCTALKIDEPDFSMNKWLVARPTEGRNTGVFRS